MSNKEIKALPKLRFPEFLNDGEWKNKRLGQLLTIGNGKDHKHLLDGNIPVYGSGGYMRSVNDYLYDGESVCIGRKGTINRPIFLSGKFWTVDTLFYTHSYRNFVPKFAYNIFRKIDWLKYNEAGGVPSLSKATIEKIKVFIPKAIAEQQKIAECLSSLDDLIAAEDKKLAALKLHKKGLLQKLFPTEGKTVPEWRFLEFRNYGEWEENSFKAFIKLYRGSSPRPIQNYITKNDGVNWIKIGDTKKSDGFKIRSVEEQITHEGAQKSRFVASGELILANSMSFGKTYELEISGCIYDGWFVLREYEKHFNKQFLLQQLNSDYLQKQYAALSTGGVVQNISSDIVYATLLKRPHLKEQQKIADFLTSIDSYIATQSEKIETLKSHRRGLMQGLFPSIEEVGE